MTAPIFVCRMLSRLGFLLFLLLSSTAVSNAQESDLDVLVSFMQGSFSSAEQAAADTNYFNIELEMVRIWPERKNGVWLYIEQAVATNKTKPYRQRIYHVEEQVQDQFTSTMYKVNGGKQWFGAFAQPTRFDSLPFDSITLIPGCAIHMQKNGAVFEGGTNERDCGNAWGKASYATSEVVVHKDKLVSWDRGWNDAGEHVWGAEHGGYVFKKRNLDTWRNQTGALIATGNFPRKEDFNDTCIYLDGKQQQGRVSLLIVRDKEGKILKGVFDMESSNTISAYLIDLAKKELMKLEALPVEKRRVLFCFELK